VGLPPTTLRSVAAGDSAPELGATAKLGGREIFVKPITAAGMGSAAATEIVTRLWVVANALGDGVDRTARSRPITLRPGRARTTAAVTGLAVTVYASAKRHGWSELTALAYKCRWRSAHCAARTHA